MLATTSFRVARNLSPTVIQTPSRLLSTTTSYCFPSTSTSESSSSQDSSSSSTTTTSPSTHYRITLRRSAIGLPLKAKATLQSLGLHRRLQSVFQPQRADIAGMILAVKELVHVENVKRLSGEQVEQMEMQDADLDALEDSNQFSNYIEDGKDGVWLNEKDEVVVWGGKQERKAPRGYKVVGNISNPIRNQEILQSKSQE